MSQEKEKNDERKVPYEGAFLYSFAGISSTADVQGSALCPGSTPGAPLLQK